MKIYHTANTKKSILISTFQGFMQAILPKNDTNLHGQAWESSEKSVQGVENGQL